jgi:hypothetical protein
MRRFAIGGSLPRALAPSTALLIVGLAGAGLLAQVLVRHTRQLEPSAALAVLEPGQHSGVPVRLDESRFDLTFDAGTRYVVVIGSLGASEQRFNVDCSSQKFPAVGSEPAEPVFALDESYRKPVDPDDHLVDSPAALQAVVLPTSGHDVVPVNFAKPTVTAVSDALHKPAFSGSRSFALHVTDGSLDDPAQYATIHAKVIAEGRHVRIYLDDQETPSQLAPGLVADVIDLFDREVIPRFQGLLGTYRDVDHDGRFTILLSPWLGRLQGGRTSVGGFVRGSDFQPFLAPPFGNRCDMMYVNSQTLPGPHLRTLLIHEYTHAVCFSRRTADACGRPRYPEEEDWLNEAMAHCAESLFGGGWSNLDYRISRFLNDPSEYPLVVGDYYRAGLWRCHGCRGATYLFLRYCLERFGAETLTRLVANPARGTHNLELATGCSFDRLFRDWTLSLVDAAERRSVPENAEEPADFDEAGESNLASASVPCDSRPNAPELAPLDLYGSLGDWGLAGPRRAVWDVDHGPQHVSLKGTAAAYLELCATGSAGKRRIRLKGSVGSQMQISVVRLSDASPQIEVEAAWSPGSRTSPTQRIGVQTTKWQEAGDCLRAIVRIARGEDLKIEQIAIEQNADQTHASDCFITGSLAKFECPSGNGGLDENASGAKHDVSRPSHGARTLRTFDFPAARLTAADTPVVVKVVAADRQGRRTTGWAIVPPRSLSQAERLVQHVP